MFRTNILNFNFIYQLPSAEGWIGLLRICSTRMRNSPGCVTGFRLSNRTPSYTTSHLDVLSESLPILLLNRIGVAIYPVT